MRITFKLNGAALRFTYIYRNRSQKKTTQKTSDYSRLGRLWFAITCLEIKVKVHVPIMRSRVGTSTVPNQANLFKCSQQIFSKCTRFSRNLSTVTKRLLCPKNTQCGLDITIVKRSQAIQMAVAGFFSLLVFFNIRFLFHLASTLLFASYLDNKLYTRWNLSHMILNIVCALIAFALFTCCIKQLYWHWMKCNFESQITPFNWRLAL